jgi:hypothetical protein
LVWLARGSVGVASGGTIVVAATAARAAATVFSLIVAAATTTAAAACSTVFATRGATVAIFTCTSTIAIVAVPRWVLLAVTTTVRPASAVAVVASGRTVIVAVTAAVATRSASVVVVATAVSATATAWVVIIATTATAVSATAVIIRLEATSAAATAAASTTEVSLRWAVVLSRGRGTRTAATRLFDAKGTTFVILARQGLAGGVGAFGCRHLDKAKATRLARVRIPHDIATVDLAKF